MSYRFQVPTDVVKTPLGLAGWLMDILKTNFQYVGLHQQWKPESCENYPAIFIKRLDWSIDKNATTMGDYYNLKLSQEYEMWKPIVATYQIICIGKEYGETEELLNSVWNYLTVFSEPIRRLSDISGIDISNMSPVEIAKEEKNFRVGTITIMLRFEILWKLLLEKGTIREAEIITR